MTLFQELWHSGMTILMVTHESDIAAYASRVIVMKDGQVQSDTQHEARLAPLNREMQPIVEETFS